MESGRDLGPQPLLGILAKHGLSATDLVRASDEQLTHKMVARAVQGRRLTANTMGKVVRALNRRAESAYVSNQLFTYAPARKSAADDPPSG